MNSPRYCGLRAVPTVQLKRPSSSPLRAAYKKKSTILEMAVNAFAGLIVILFVALFLYSCVLFVSHCFSRMDRADAIHDRQIRQAAQTQRGPDVVNGVLENSDHNHATVQIVTQKKP